MFPVSVLRYDLSTNEIQSGVCRCLINLFKASSTLSQRKESHGFSSSGQGRRGTECKVLLQGIEMYGEENIKIPYKLSLRIEKCKFSVNNKDYVVQEVIVLKRDCSLDQ